MGVVSGLNKNFSNFTILVLLLFFVPLSEGGGFLGKLKTAWNNVFYSYPFTSTLQLHSHIKGQPIYVSCVLDYGPVKKAHIKPGGSFSFEFERRSSKRDHMKCFLWQGKKEIGWFYPLYYGTSACENVAPNLWSKNKFVCKRKLYRNHVEGGLRVTGGIEKFGYRPIHNRWSLFVPGAVIP